MKNLLSKISKLALIPALAFTLNTGKAHAQKVEFNPGVYAGVMGSSYSGFKVYDNWESHFKDIEGDETLKYKKIKDNFDVSVGTDLGILLKNNVSFGLTSKYSLTENFEDAKKYLSLVELHDWDYDYTRIHGIYLKQKTPSLGAYLKIPFDKENRLALRSSFRKAGTVEEKREDVYLEPELNSKLKCEGPPTPRDETEDLTRVFEETKSNTLLNKNSVEYQFYSDGAIIGFELFYETDWKKVHEIGASLNISWDNLY